MIHLLCIEPDGRQPARVALEIELDTPVSVHTIPARSTSRGLRRTVLRRGDEPAPVDAMRLCRVSVVQVDEAGGLGLRLLEIEPGVQLRIGNQRLLASEEPLDLSLDLVADLPAPQRGMVPFTLRIEREAAQGATVAVAGSGMQISQVRYTSDSPWWILTDTGRVTLSLGQRLWDGFRDRLAKIGISGRVFSFLSGFLIAGAVGAYAAWSENRRANTASEEAELASQQLEDVTAASEAAAEEHLSCQQILADLKSRDADTTEKRKSQLGTVALWNQSVEVAVMHGGSSRMALEGLKRRDEAARVGLEQAIVDRMGTLQGRADDCLALADVALDAEIPSYILAYHPEATRACTANYNTYLDGVMVKGHFGLSDRTFARLAHGSSEAGGDADRVLLPRPSAKLLAEGYRRTLVAMLRFGRERAGNPPVLPHQAQLWALALFDVINLMPVVEGPGADSTIEDCVDAILQARLESVEGGLSPDDPLLPDLVTVLDSAEPLVPLTPTTRCPFSSDNGIDDGVAKALAAAGRVVDHQLRTSSPAAKL